MEMIMKLDIDKSACSLSISVAIKRHISMMNLFCISPSGQPIYVTLLRQYLIATFKKKKNSYRYYKIKCLDK